MSFSLADSTGIIEEFASIGGYADFVAWAKKQDAAPLKKFPAAAGVWDGPRIAGA
jgi:hypothetical protein